MIHENISLMLLGFVVGVLAKIAISDFLRTKDLVFLGFGIAFSGISILSFFSVFYG